MLVQLRIPGNRRGINSSLPSKNKSHQLLRFKGDIPSRETPSKGGTPYTTKHSIHMEVSSSEMQCSPKPRNPAPHFHYIPGASKTYSVYLI